MWKWEPSGLRKSESTAFDLSIILIRKTLVHTVKEIFFVSLQGNLSTGVRFPLRTSKMSTPLEKTPSMMPVWDLFSGSTRWKWTPYSVSLWLTFKTTTMDYVKFSLLLNLSFSCREEIFNWVIHQWSNRCVVLYVITRDNIIVFNLVQWHEKHRAALVTIKKILERQDKMQGQLLLFVVDAANFVFCCQT